MEPSRCGNRLGTRWPTVNIWARSSGSRDRRALTRQFAYTHLRKSQKSARDRCAEAYKLGAQLMIIFNTILQQAGVEPDTVRLVRHQDARNPGGTTLYEMWRSEPHRLEAYQEIQNLKRFAIGDTVASFVATPPPRGKPCSLASTQ